MVAFSAIVFLHTPLFLWLQDVWRDQGLAMAAASIFCPLVIAGLVYLRRDEVSQILGSLAPRFSRFGVTVMLSSGVVAATAVFMNEPVVMAVSLPVSVYGYLVWTRGAQAVAPMVLPLFLLVFLIPTTQFSSLSAVTWLQVMSAELATQFLGWSGLPSTRDGFVITTGITTNTVTEECSGIATLFALVLYGLVTGYIMRLNLRRIALVVTVLLSLALLVNSVRIAFISWLLYRFGEMAAEGPLHNGSAYVLFAVAYGVTIALCIFLSKRQSAQARMRSS